MSERPKFTRSRRGRGEDKAASTPERTSAPAERPARARAPRKIVVTEISKPGMQRAASADPAKTPAKPAASEAKAPDSTPAVLTPDTRVDTPGPFVLETAVVPSPTPQADASKSADAPLAMPAFKDKAKPAEVQPASAQVPRTARASRADDVWHKLATLQLSAATLEQNRIISATRRDPAHTAFDVLRTRLLHALKENGWSRVAITSPTKDCGKTFVAANLAMSLSRQEACRTLLLDMDMRKPSLASVLGAERPGSLGDVLRGMTPPEDHFVRLGDGGLSIGRNIALGLNGVSEGYASELLQLPETGEVLRSIHTRFKPDVVLYDMPPALFHDDVMAFRPHIDAVLMVVGGGITRPNEVKEVERRLGDSTPLLGIIMNKAEGPTVRSYSY
ncbi:CpsD/CapB family tyrosine-protein kinase [Pseudaestuariivita sp.]|uniref:CpsD/CapB family tyrosine-protein kinase n=1 Tax=Pseudaestuariivita sp. TaxID=2211669 RepID=UPI004059F587